MSKLLTLSTLFLITATLSLSYLPAHAQNTLSITANMRNDIYGLGLAYESKIMNQRLVGFELSDRASLQLSISNQDIEEYLYYIHKGKHRRVYTGNIQNVHFGGSDIGYDFLLSKYIGAPNTRFYWGAGLNLYSHFILNNDYGSNFIHEIHGRILTGFQYQVSSVRTMFVELHYRHILHIINEDHIYFSPLQVTLGIR